MKFGSFPGYAFATLLNAALSDRLNSATKLGCTATRLYLPILRTVLQIADDDDEFDEQPAATTQITNPPNTIRRTSRTTGTLNAYVATCNEAEVRMPGPGCPG